VTGFSVILLEHVSKGLHYYADAKRVCGGGLLKSAYVALGAGSILSSQEITRVGALIRRRSLFSIFRRVDWFDGDQDRIKLNIQLESLLNFAVNSGILWGAFSWIKEPTK
jgi:hypothetical protein